MTIKAYPLQWPLGWKRTEPAWRVEAKFGRKVSTGGPGSWQRTQSLTVPQAIERVLTELRRMGLGTDDVVISTNLELRLDGLPKGGQRAPTDPGAAVYWRDRSGGAPRVMAIDQYTHVEDNLAAIAATLDAMRAIERHGGAVVLERAFTGFTALPAPDAARPWRDVLGLGPRDTPTADELTMAYRRAASKAHPDKGGSDAAMAAVNAAYEAAKKESAS